MTYRPASDEEIAAAVAEAAKTSDETMPPTDPDCARQVIALIRQLGGDVTLHVPDNTDATGRPCDDGAHGVVNSSHSDRQLFWDTEGDGEMTLAVEPAGMDDGMTMDLVVPAADLLGLARVVADENGYQLIEKEARQ